MGTNLKKGICFVVIAVVLFAVSCIDRIEVVGRYKTEEMGMPVTYTFGLFGDLKGKIDVDSNNKYAKAIAGATEVSGKWKLDGDELVIEIAGGEDSGKYKAGFTKLTLLDDDGDEAGEFKRDGIIGYLCISVIMKVVSGVLLLVGIGLMLKRDDDYYYDSGYTAGYTPVETTDYTSGRICPNCGTAADPADAFCQNCGSPVGGSTQPAPAPAPAPTPEPAVAHCANCGGVVDPADAFCQNCGTPVGGGFTPTPTPEPVPAPTPAPIPAEEPKKGGLTSTFRPAPTEPISDDEHFTQAGDL